MLSLSQKKLLDFYLGMLGLIILRPIVQIVGKILKREHDPQPRGDIVVQKFLGGGSLLLAQNALIGIKQTYPDRSLILITTNNVKPFGELLGVFDQIIVIDDSSFLKLIPSSLRALFRVYRSDTVLDLEVFSRLSTIFSLLTCARNRISFICDEVFLRKNVSTHLVYFNRSSGQYIFYDQMAFLLGAIAASNQDCRKNILDNCHRSDSAFNSLIIGHGCSDYLKERCLMPSEWLEIFKRQIINKSFKKIIFLGSQTDYRLAEAIIALLKEEFSDQIFENLCGQLTLQESVGVLSSAREFWGIDSALLHFARLLNVPSTSFWGPTDPCTRLRPNLELIETVNYQRIHCSPCVHTTEQPPCMGNNLCIRELFKTNSQAELFKNTIVV